MQKGGRVLIVEDEFLVALQLEDILIDCGHDVVGNVSDLASADGITEAADVALVDLNLRDGLTGPEIARRLCDRFGTRIIYVTANPSQIDMPAECTLGVIQKPFSRGAIQAAVAYALADDLGVPRPAELQPLPGHTIRRSA
jgi:DNA-binding response OmpR family regulator